ncbi:MAG: hypothetical protein ACT4N9_07885 [Paracoccaceae bacterium]
MTSSPAVYLPSTAPSDHPRTIIFGMRVGHGVRIQCLLMAKAIRGGARIIYREDLLTAAGRQMYQDMRAWFLADPANSVLYYADHEVQERWRPEYSPEALNRLRGEILANPPRRVVFLEPSTMEEVIGHLGGLLEGVDLQYIDPDRRPVDESGKDLLDFSHLPLPMSVNYPVDARPARLSCRHSAPSLRVRPYDQRDFAFATHDGGWAMGNFRDVLDLLPGPAAILLPRERAVAEKEALLPRASLFFDIESAASEPGEFARLAEVTQTGYRILPPMQHHGSLEVIARSRALVSKPGGHGGRQLSGPDADPVSRPDLDLRAGQCRVHRTDRHRHASVGVSGTRGRACAAGKLRGQPGPSGRGRADHRQPFRRDRGRIRPARAAPGCGGAVTWR